jgi:hypothetical protein
MNDINPYQPVSPATLAAFHNASRSIIEETVARALKRRVEVVQHGDQAEQLISSGMEFTTRMLEAALMTGEIPILEDELLWAKDRLPHDGVALEHILSRLIIYREVIAEKLPEESAREVNRFIDWMITRQQELIQDGR